MSDRQKLVSVANRVIDREGSQKAGVDGITLLRISQPVARMPVLYEPCVVFVLQGQKHGYLGTDHFLYDPQHYLVLSAALAFECETVADRNEPLLAVYVRLGREVVSELLAMMSNNSPDADERQLKAIEAVPFDEELSDGLLRLMTVLSRPEEARVLGKGLVREIIYRVLLGPQGRGLRASLGFSGHFAQITKALRRIHADYAQSLTVVELASGVGMSPSIFHLHFRKLTATSPLQYMKAIRLHRARALILDMDIGAAQAAREVGYESPQQFGREFKRLFGHSPMTEAARLRSIPMLD